jgi:small ligand-binding sensory domain FIST
MPFAAALSTAPAAGRALDDVCGEVRGRLGHVELAAVFFSPHHADAAAAIAKTLYDRLQPKAMIGCIGEAIVGTGQEIEKQPALSLWLADWGGRAAAEPFHLAPRQTSDGLSLLGWPDALVEGDPAAATMLVLGNPYTFPAAEIFLPQVNSEYKGLRVHGGMASGMSDPEQTPLLFGDEVVDVGAVGALLRGDVAMRSVVSQGCRPVGAPFVITKGQDNVIVELGGRSPLEQLRDLYQQLPAGDQELFQRGPHIGLVLNEYQDRFQRGDFLVRNLYGIDRSSGALAITDRVRVGQTVQFHIRDAETADEDLRLLLRHDRSEHAAAPAAALLFTCNGRGTRLFPAPHHDAAALAAEIGPVPLAGFFAAGELGPVGGLNFIHGFTASALIFEDGPPAA